MTISRSSHPMAGMTNSVSPIHLKDWNLLYYLYAQFCDSKNTDFIDKCYENVVKAVKNNNTKYRPTKSVFIDSTQRFGAVSVAIPQALFQSLTVVEQSFLALCCKKLSVSTDIHFTYLVNGQYPRSSQDLFDFIIFDSIEIVQVGNMSKDGVVPNDSAQLFATESPTSSLISLEQFGSAKQQIALAVTALHQEVQKYQTYFGLYVGTYFASTLNRLSLNFAQGIKCDLFDSLACETLKVGGTTRSNSDLAVGKAYHARLRPFYEYGSTDRIIEIPVGRDLVALRAPKEPVLSMKVYSAISSGYKLVYELKNDISTHISTIWTIFHKTLMSVLDKAVVEAHSNKEHPALLYFDLNSDASTDSRLPHFIGIVNLGARHLAATFPPSMSFALTSTQIRQLEFVKTNDPNSGFELPVDDPIWMLSNTPRPEGTQPVTALGDPVYVLDYQAQAAHQVPAILYPNLAILSTEEHPLGKKPEKPFKVYWPDPSILLRQLFGAVYQLFMFVKTEELSDLYSFLIDHLTVADWAKMLLEVGQYNMLTNVLSAHQYTLTGQASFEMRDFYHRISLAWIYSLMRIFGISGKIGYPLTNWFEILSILEANAAEVDRIILGVEPTVANLKA